MLSMGRIQPSPRTEEHSKLSRLKKVILGTDICSNPTQPLDGCRTLADFGNVFLDVAGVVQCISNGNAAGKYAM